LTKKEREEYINQDRVDLKEFIPPRAIDDPWDSTGWGEVSMNTSKQVNRIILELHNDGMPIKDIAYHVPVSLTHIYRIISKYVP
jgi:hypothetical protein